MTVTAKPPHVQRVTHTAAPTASRLVVGLTFLAVASLGAAGQSAPTFSRDIAPIFFEHCAGCHRPGQSAPFSLLTFEDARPWARAIRQEVATRQMPPWKPEPGYGDFARVRRLSDGQIAMIDRWVEGGATEGDRADLPRTPRWTEGWQLGTPDLVIEMPEPYTVPAEGEDIFRSFAVPVPISQTRYVRAVEIKPGNYRVVHHGRILVDSTGTARQLEDLDPEPGYSGMLYDASDFPDGHFLGWLPGTQPRASPEGLSWRLDPGEALVLQLHLLPTGVPETFRARVAIYFADSPPTRSAFVLRLGTQDIDIPAGERNHVLEDEYVLPIDVDALSVYPHAHYLGKEIQAHATLPSGERKWLVYIRDWDFSWQDEYEYVEPVFLPKGTVLSARFIHDNSSENPQNPQHPPRRVTYGSGSRDEMADVQLQVVPRRPDELPVLVDEMRRRARQQQIVGDLKRLETRPADPLIHDHLGSLLIDEDRLEEAIAHLREAVRLNPQFALAYFHLGYACFLDREVDQAIMHFERALAINPGFVQALHNLGKLRQAQGRSEDAVGLFRQALAINPDDAEAHNTLGGIFQWLGDLGQATGHFERAVQSRPDSALAHHNLAFTLTLDGRPDEGTKHFRQAMMLDPGWSAPFVELAWVLATSPDATARNAGEAVRLAGRAVKLTDRKDPSALDALAAAYASAGRYDEAVEAAEAALEAAGSQAADQMFSEVRRRLELYKQRRPYRESRIP